MGAVSYQWYRDGVPIVWGNPQNGVNGVDGLDGAQGITATGDNKRVYVTGSIDDSIAWFEKNSSGKLTFIGMSKNGTNRVQNLNAPVSITISSTILSYMYWLQIHWFGLIEIRVLEVSHTREV